jgi:ketosteroid isomerase-like protein
LALTFVHWDCPHSSFAAAPAFKTAQSHSFAKLTCPVRDTLVPQDILDVVTLVVNAVTSFNLQTVAEIYTPNAVIADDEPPYSWNGPTAGIQWVNAVEKACKVNGLTKLTSKVLPVFQQSVDNVYVVVPVTFTGKLPGKQLFEVNGAFTFILRQVNGKWMIKSQTWMQKKGVE